MKRRTIAVSLILGFVGLAEFGPTGAQTADQVLAVQKLKAQADDLYRKGEKAEASERYKDCICLLDLQKWDVDKKREFLLRAANVEPKQKVQAPFVVDGSSKYLFVREILETYHVKSASDLPIVRVLVDHAQLGRGPQDELAIRLLEEVSALEANSTEEKRTQLDVLQTVFQAIGNEGGYGPAQAKMKALALEIDPTKNAKDAEQQSRVLWVVLYSFMSPLGDPSSVENANVFRDSILECIALSEKYPGKVHIDLSSAIGKAMTVDKLSVLVPMLERYVALQKANYPQHPQHYQADRCNLAWAYLDAGRYADAEALFKDISATCRNNRFSLFTYEYAELSLGKCYMMQKKFDLAKRCLTELVAFLADPGIADVNQYGAMAQGMLGEIAMNEGDWKTARRQLERADERMPLLTNLYPSFQNISFIRDNLPSESSVLRGLVKVYSHFKLTAKAEEFLQYLTKAESAEASRKVNESSQGANRRLNLAFQLRNASKINAAVKSYLHELSKSEAKKENVLESVMGVTRRCEETGTSAAGLECVDEALKFGDTLTKEQRVRLRFLQAHFFIAQDKFEAAREKLLEPYLGETESARVKWIANSLIAESYLREGKLEEAESRLGELLKGPDDNSISAMKPDEPKDWFDTEGGADYLSLYVANAYANLAEILISRGLYLEAEAKLKNYVSGRSNPLGAKIKVFPEQPVVNSLLAYAEALQGKNSESKLNIRTVLASGQRFNGFVNARANKFAGLTYKVLGDPDRGRRYLSYALRDYEAILPAEDLELKTCRSELEKITPGLKLETSHRI